jgi:hypothetical protein
MTIESSVDLVATAETAHRNIVDRLCSLYRSEFAAANTYALALQHESLHPWGFVLRRQHAVHQERLGVLAERIRSVGAAVPTTSGAWGTFTRIVEDTAASISSELALAVLEEEEDSLELEYERALEVLDSESQLLVSERLLPAQRVTHYVVRRAHESAA